MLNDWTNYGPGQGGGDIKKQYGKRSHLKIDVTRYYLYNFLKKN